MWIVCLGCAPHSRCELSASRVHYYFFLVAPMTQNALHQRTCPKPARRVCLPAGIAVLVAVAVFMTGRGAQASPGPVWLQIRPIDAATSQIVVQNLGTAPGANPAISWDIYLSYDHSKGRLANVTPGSEWVAMDCDFVANLNDGQAPMPSINDVMINGFCTTRIPDGIVGQEVVVATLHWSDCREGFVVDLRTGVNEFGAPVTDFIDNSNDPYILSEEELFDGGACGDATVGLQTTLDNPIPQPSPLLTSAPLLAAAVGTLLVIAGGAIILLRRRER